MSKRRSNAWGRASPFAARMSAEIKLLEQALSVNKPAAEFLGGLEALLEPKSAIDCSEHDEFLFNSPCCQTLLDAWIVGKYAELSGADCVRLSGDRWPDGVVTFGSKEEKIEVTEALLPGRRRGDEFRANQPRVGDGGPEAWDRAAAAVPGVLRESIAKKEAKRYSEPVVLVVLLTVPSYGTRKREIEAHIHSCRIDARAGFVGVKVLWNDELYDLGRDDAKGSV